MIIKITWRWCRIGCIMLTVASLMLACNGPYTTALLVRHAEKANGADPPLTAAGQARAQALKVLLADAGIRAIYATDTTRSRATGQPLADALGLPLTIYANPADLTAAILTDHHGEAVLVVGHSNTVGQLIAAFGADQPASLPNPIDENDFDNLITILVHKDGSATALHSRYGAPSP